MGSQKNSYNPPATRTLEMKQIKSCRRFQSSVWKLQSCPAKYK